MTMCISIQAKCRAKKMRRIKFFNKLIKMLQFFLFELVKFEMDLQHSNCIISTRQNLNFVCSVGLSVPFLDICNFVFYLLNKLMYILPPFSSSPNSCGFNPDFTKSADGVPTKRNTIRTTLECKLLPSQAEKFQCSTKLR